MLRTLVVVGLLGLGLGAAHADDFDPLYACKVPAAGTKISVNIAPDVSLGDLATWVTGFTCKNVVFASDVAKHATKLTVISPQKMTAKQALQLFVDAVEATGLVVQIKPDTIIIKLGPNMPRSCPDATVSSTKGDVATDEDGSSFDHIRRRPGLRRAHGGRSIGSTICSLGSTRNAHTGRGLRAPSGTFDEMELPS